MCLERLCGGVLGVVRGDYEAPGCSSRFDLIDLEGRNKGTVKEGKPRAWRRSRIW